MSFLRRDGRKTSRVLVTVLSLAAFQVLAVIGATTAFAVTDCNFNPGNGEIACTIDPGEDLAIAVDGSTGAADLDPAAAAGSVLQSVNGGAWAAIGSASSANTTHVVVLGSNGNQETFTINNNVTNPFGGAGGGVTPVTGEFAATTTWAIDLGTNAAAPLGDTLLINGGEGADTVVLTNTTFTLNTATGTMLGVEYAVVSGNSGADVIDGSVLTSLVFTAANTAPLIPGAGLSGGLGNDTLSPGIPTAGDTVLGGGGTSDTVSYATATSTQCIVINNPVAAPWAGLDANCDGDIADATDAADNNAALDIENLVSGAGNDRLFGAPGFAETFTPGDGNDNITGQTGDFLDWSTSSAGMTITPTAGTAVGQGNDVFTGVDGFVGSAFDDVLIWPNAAPVVLGFEGGDGVDTIDASLTTTGQAINVQLLDDAFDATVDTTDNVLGGSGNDTITGNGIRNNLVGNDGNDTLTGGAGNDTMEGGLGNDTFAGGLGADRVSFANSATRVNVDMNLGFASGEGDDSFAGAGPAEIIVGSPFNDSITGGGGIIAINFLFAGGAGNDRLTGSGSNDTLRGGAGNDRMRGLEGGDTIKGGPGTRDRAWGGPGVDFCQGTEFERGCE